MRNKLSDTGNYGNAEPDDIDSQNSASDDEGTKSVATTNHTFEFTNNVGIVRFIRLFFILQTLAIMIDNPEIRIPVLFRMFCRGPLFYVIRFYSRPFIDVVYIIEQYLLQKINIPTNTKFHRLLSYTSSYEPMSSKSPQFDIALSFISDRNWHSIKYLSHYFLGLFFVVLSLLFTLSFWHVKNYTNREDMDRWLKTYAGRFWWLIGGLNVFWSVSKACVVFSGLVFLLFCIAKGFNSSSVPESYIIGT